MRLFLYPLLDITSSIIIFMYLISPLPGTKNKTSTVGLSIVHFSHIQITLHLSWKVIKEPATYYSTHIQTCDSCGNSRPVLPVRSRVLFVFISLRFLQPTNMRLMTPEASLQLQTLTLQTKHNQSKTGPLWAEHSKARRKFLMCPQENRTNHKNPKMCV